MTKIEKQLEEQSINGSTLEERHNAIKCKEIYNELKKLDEKGHVWQREWDVLVRCSAKRINETVVVPIYRPSAIGMIFYKGLD